VHEYASANSEQRFDAGKVVNLTEAERLEVGVLLGWDNDALGHDESNRAGRFEELLGAVDKE
jgi:hypothetical protein